MRLVILESPYSNNIERNVRYGQQCMRDCLMRGEAPLASHLLYTQENVLDDLVPEERTLGMNAGFAWGSKADAVVVYYDFGITEGMTEGIRRATANGTPVEYRSIYPVNPLMDV